MPSSFLTRSAKQTSAQSECEHFFLARLVILKEALKTRRNSIIKQRRQTICPETEPVLLEGHKEFLAAAPPYILKLNSDNFSDILDSVVFFRKQLSKETNPPIEATLNLGIVPRVLDLVTKDSSIIDDIREKVRFEGAWMLCNLASGSSEQTQRLDKFNVTGRLLDLLSSRQKTPGSTELAEQIIWTLGNFAGDSVDFRNKLLNRGMLPVILHFIGASSKLSMLRNATWTLSNLCRGKPVPDLSKIAPALPVLATLIYSADTEVVTDALWALSYCSDGENARIQAVLESGCVQKVVDHLKTSQYSHKVPALRTLGNIVSGDDAQAQVAISCGFVDTLKDLLASPKKNIRREALWAASNLAAGSRSQIQCLIDAHLFPKINQFLASTSSSTPIHFFISIRAFTHLLTHLLPVDTNPSC